MRVSLDRVMGFATASTCRRVKTSLSKGQRKEIKKGKGERKEKGKVDGQLDLLRVKSIKVHQIQNSCFFKVTNMCWKLRKMRGK